MEQPKNVAGGCLLSLAIILGVPLAWFNYSAFAPHLLLNPTTRYLYQYREMGREDVSLIPGLFAEGESKENVESKMTSAGLDIWSKRYDDTSNHQVFHLVAGHNIACGYELFIEADYDEQDRLKTATVHQGGACL